MIRWPGIIGAETVKVTVEATVGATVGATVEVTVEKRVIGYHGGWCDLIVVSLTRAVMYSPIILPS